MLSRGQLFLNKASSVQIWPWADQLLWIWGCNCSIKWDSWLMAQDTCQELLLQKSIFSKQRITPCPSALPVQGNPIIIHVFAHFSKVLNYLNSLSGQCVPTDVFLCFCKHIQNEVHSVNFTILICHYHLSVKHLFYWDKKSTILVNSK